MLGDASPRSLAHRPALLPLPYLFSSCSLSLSPPPWSRSVSGKYHTVTCLDVMIHYPQDKADAMIAHLASLADQRLIISFAPKTPYYSILKRIGELFPGPSKVGEGNTIKRAVDERCWCCWVVFLLIADWPAC